MDLNSSLTCFQLSSAPPVDRKRVPGSVPANYFNPFPQTRVQLQAFLLARRRQWRLSSAITTSVAEIAQLVILSGHSHIPCTVSLPQGKLLINPGSVGMPAYSMETYGMESGSPHAHYALLHQKQHGWQVEHIQVPYAWEQAAQVARANQRTDWAQWLTTGRAR